MRLLVGLLLLAALAGAQEALKKEEPKQQPEKPEGTESKPTKSAGEEAKPAKPAEEKAKPKAPEKNKPTHDELGFPVTFNDEIITRNDVLRRLDVPEEALGPGAILGELEKYLMDKIEERLGQIWRIQIEESQVEAHLRREMDLKGGEAKFYEYLYQSGTTLPRYKQHIRLQILKAYIQFMLTRGYTPDQRLLPWDVLATPAELKIAYDNDAARRESAARVHAVEINLSVDTAALMREVGMGLKLREEKRKRVNELVRKTRAEIESGKPYEQIATEWGVNVERAKKMWIPLPKSEATDPILRFYQTAEQGSWSEPMWQSSGDCVLAYLIEINRPGDRGLDDPEINQAYRQRIHDLRRLKVGALIRLRALESSLVRPDRVREQMRKILLADFREAREGLRLLGLH
ncbi:MAG: SurA N-terminal domain-containing protein [Planctomycetota bacterium]|jgi:hypothetical protein